MYSAYAASLERKRLADHLERVLLNGILLVTLLVVMAIGALVVSNVLLTQGGLALPQSPGASN